MKWTPNRSVFLSKICVLLFVAAYAAVVLACPVAVKEYETLRTAQLSEVHERFMMITIYLCAAPVGVILWKLWRLLGNIARERIFVRENIVCLRLISWMCFGVAALTLVSAWYYVMWIVIACCMAFMGLLIRVIKNVFERAKEIKEENDFTI